MRQRWFTVLLVASLVVTGTASAWAAQACLYKAAPAASHDCCPQPPSAPDDTSDHGKKMDCRLGQACRSAPAVTPQLPVFATAIARMFEQPLALDRVDAVPSVPAGVPRHGL